MKLPLAEVVHLKAEIGKTIQELIRERNQVSTVTVSEKEKETGIYEKPERTLEEITAELEEARRHEVEVAKLLSKANLEHTVKWDGKDIPLASGLLITKQLRGELSNLKNFANKKKVSSVHSYSISSNEYEVTLYEPNEMKKKADKLERQIRKLSTDLNIANGNILIDVDFADKYYE